MEGRITEPRKTCAGCEVSKPWSAFYAKARWEDGSMRQPHSRCKDCHKAKTRERQRNGGRDLKARYARLKADPERYERERERLRARREDPETHAHDLAMRRRRWREVHGTPPERWYGPRFTIDEPEVRLPIGPFAAWLRRRAAEVGTAELSRQLGIDDGQLRRYMHERQARVTLDVVDAALTPTTTGLWELYPDLYAEEALAA